MENYLKMKGLLLQKKQVRSSQVLPHRETTCVDDNQGIHEHDNGDIAPSTVGLFVIQTKINMFYIIQTS